MCKYLDVKMSIGLNVWLKGYLGCFRKTLFRDYQKYNPPRISQGVSLRGSKMIFDSDKV